MSVVLGGISMVEMKPTEYKFVRKDGKNYIFLNSDGIKENWRKVIFSKPGFVLKYNKMLFEFHDTCEEAV